MVLNGSGEAYAGAIIQLICILSWAVKHMSTPAAYQQVDWMGFTHSLTTGTCSLTCHIAGLGLVPLHVITAYGSMLMTVRPIPRCC